MLDKVLTVIQFFSGSVNDILDELNGEDEIRDSRWGQVPIVVMTMVIMMINIMGFFSEVIYGDVYDCDDDQCDKVITKRTEVMITPMTRQPSVEYSSEGAK